jgi:hypothetical protein
MMVGHRMCDLPSFLCADVSSQVEIKEIMK